MADRENPAAAARVETPEVGAGQRIYEQLHADLMAVRIEPDQRLTVDALARTYDISQTPVREALALLESEGLVTKTHLRGFRATAVLKPHEVTELYEVRQLLEPFTARRAAELRTELELDQMRDLHERMNQIAVGDRTSSWSGEFPTWDAEFHDLIAAAARNSLMRDALYRLHAHLHIFRLRRDQSVTTAATAEHAVLLAAIERNDANVAEAACRTHLERSLQRVRQALAVSGPPDRRDNAVAE